MTDNGIDQLRPRYRAFQAGKRTVGFIALGRSNATASAAFAACHCHAEPQTKYGHTTSTPATARRSPAALLRCRSTVAGEWLTAAPPTKSLTKWTRNADRSLTS